MLNIHRSTSTKENKLLRRSPRKQREDNIAWLARHVRNPDRVHVVLLGGRGSLAFRLRVSQAHARDDLTPSHWSHVLMLGAPKASFGKTKTYEISLEPKGGFGFPTARNGVQQGVLASYASAEQFPNVCVIALPKTITFSAVDEAVQRFATQRNVVDALENVLTWLAFGWGVGSTGNPLLAGVGLPAAVFVEHVVGGCGMDLTPGLASKSSCPEAIWQSARWWHESAEEGTTGQALEGAVTTDHVLEP